MKRPAAFELLNSVCWRHFHFNDLCELWKSSVVRLSKLNIQLLWNDTFSRCVKMIKKKAQVATHKIKSRLVWLYNTKGAIHNGVLCASACYTARRCIHLRGKYAWLQQQSDSEYWNEDDVFLEWNSWKNPSGPRLWKVGNCKYTSISGKPLPVCVAALSLKKTSLALRQCYLLISQTLHFMKTYSDVSLAVGSTLKDVSIQELEFYQQTLPASHSMVIRIRPGRATAVCVAFRPFVHMKRLTIRLFHSSVNNRNVTHAKCCGEELFTGSTFESRKVKSVAQSGLSLFGWCFGPEAFIKINIH